MAKKKDIKTKKKDTEKVKDRKTGLSNHEREINLLTVNELKHNIEWRNHISTILEEDLKLYKENVKLQQEDKKEAIKLLEESVEEQTELIEKIQRILSDAERNLGEDKQAEKLAANLLQVNQERLSNQAELGILRKKLNSLEAYNPNKIDEKIKDIDRQLLELKNDEDLSPKLQEQNKRRKDIFTKEMQDILEKEVDSFQSEIVEKLDKNFERIAEETRWWANTVNSLKAEAERLESVNDTKAMNVKVSQRNLKQRKDLSLEESQKLLESEIMIKDVIRTNRELALLKKDNIRHMEHQKSLEDNAKSLKQNIENAENFLASDLNQMKRYEIELEKFKVKHLSEISYENQLKDYIEKAQELIEEEVKYSLIVTYDGPPEKKNTIEKMRKIFEEVTRLICERITT